MKIKICQSTLDTTLVCSQAQAHCLLLEIGGLTALVPELLKSREYFPSAMGLVKSLIKPRAQESHCIGKNSFSSTAAEKAPISQGHKCYHCNEHFITKSNLQRHIRDKHEKKSLPCKDCGTTFGRIDKLKDHQKRPCVGK